MLCAAPSYAEPVISSASCGPFVVRWLRISRRLSQCSEPCKEIVLAEDSLSELSWQLCSIERLELHSEADLDVAMCGVELGVTEPGGDGGDVDVGLE